MCAVILVTQCYNVDTNGIVTALVLVMNTTTNKTDCKLCARNTSGLKCKRHHKAHMAALRAEADKVIATGKCPCCGTGLVRNLALTGWWQCGGYASEGFRHKGFESAPKCSYQVFGS